MEILIVTLIAYFIPSVIALCRDHSSKMAIVVVNVLFGWTFIGWFWALIWSLASKGSNVTIINNNNNG